MEKFPITHMGITKLEEELRQLKTVERPQVIKAISEARELGDLSENAEYHAARERQSHIEGRIMDLEDKMARADVIDISKLSGTIVRFGATVSLVDEESDEQVTYTIVCEYEADLRAGLLSVASPLSRALIGKSQGDSVEVVTPKALKTYEILSVTYGKQLT